MSSSSVDAIVVGSGPNGLAAAITLARAGLSVRVYEAAPTPGGGMRTAELTLPGFRHDICSTVQAMLISPFFQTVDLAALGVRLRAPQISYANPLDGGRAALSFESVAATAEALPAPDGRRYRRLMQPLVDADQQIWPEVLGTLRRPPRHPLTMARLGALSLPSVTGLAGRFDSEEAQALLAGAGAHSMRRLDATFTAAYALVLALTAHATGWPVVEGGSQQLADGLVGELVAAGGEIVCDSPIDSLAQLPPSRAVLLDVAASRLASIAGDRLPRRYWRSLRRFKHGPGVFKLDWALSGPVPWTNPDVARAGTVHLGGTMAEIARSEADVEAGRHSDSPYVLAVQPTVADPSRAPAGGHVLWAYCHVPAGSTLDMTERIEAQVERFAPGFRDLVIGRAARNAVEFEKYDANYVGGDINGGRASLSQALLGPAPLIGPIPRWSRYATPLDGVYLCSSSTPPGGGVHGMCGYNAAREALRREFGR